MKTVFKVIAIVLLILIGFVGGWWVNKTFFTETFRSSPLRVSGFEFVKPLLVCDTSNQKEYPELKVLNGKLTGYINNEKASGNVDSVSIYFQDFKTDGRITINPDEKFHPSSIGKLPVAIALYRVAESYPQVLSEKITYNGKVDYNSGAEIPPKESLKIGETYTINQLIETMIKYSDNNSTAELIKFLGLDTLKLLYNDLQIDIPADAEFSKTNDFIKTRDVSYFFRVLYNSTYLTNELSEKLLRLLSQADYKNGIVAGIPNGVVSSHKFGLETIFDGQNSVKGRELHDCGIVYHPQNPYLLCIMTKSSSSNVSTLENIIKNISSITYKEVDSYYKQKQ